MADLTPQNSFNTRAVFDGGSGPATMYRLDRFAQATGTNLAGLPFSIRVLAESLLRNENGYDVTKDDVLKLAAYDPAKPTPEEIPFKPARVILQDFTGVPCVVDLAALRSAMARMGGDPQKINPHIPVDLVIDHSVQVDEYATPLAAANNAAIEFERNKERYVFLRWGQAAFRNFRVVPPSNGIVHQVNLEYLAPVVQTRPEGRDTVAFPDSLVGTDSHTTMINGLGVVGWGVGGIEAEAVMLNQPIYMLIPEVIGVKVTGKLPAGATATDLVLRVTEILRKKGVVDKFVEFFGPGLPALSLPDRATIANMAPEYGATMGFFPVDDETLRYLRRSGRPESTVRMVERYYMEQGMYRTAETPDPQFRDVVELDLETIRPALAGPKRPQDRVNLDEMKKSFRTALEAPVDKRGYALAGDTLKTRGTVKTNGAAYEIGHGAVVIAAITSCTNTSNPSVLLGAGLLAQKAVEAGLTVAPHVKTSLAPGSRVVTEYLQNTGLMPYLEKLGFHIVGYGCTTCIGNSGPLPQPVVDAVKQGKLVAASVLSGNRNFEGRVNPHVKANYLASPPLVVAYALAGTVDIDLTREPIGKGSGGKDVFLRDIWPSNAEVAKLLDKAMDPAAFNKIYQGIENANEKWNSIPVSGGAIYEWDRDSTYIQEPPFFVNMPREPAAIKPIVEARALVKAGNSITTDHISPAGNIAADSPAGKYLLERGVTTKDFNQYGARRGNDRVMTRGTFANIQFKNQLAPGTEGGWTTFLPTGEVMSIYDAAEKYKAAGTSTIVLAGTDYGMGSSRDWAAKGTYLLGVKAVIAESFERIHRSNLVGMGVLPLQFKAGENAESLGLSGKEFFTIHVDGDLKPKDEVRVTAESEPGKARTFHVVCRIDTPVEIDYYRNGGILHTVLRNILRRG